jgi:hypothetical protein
MILSTRRAFLIFSRIFCNGLQGMHELQLIFSSRFQSVEPELVVVTL